MGITERDWSEAAALLGAAGEATLLCHVDPDGDALGSMLALGRFLADKGTRVQASFADAGRGADGPPDVPRPYRLLPGLDLLVPQSELPRAPELVVTLDAGSPDRLGVLRGLVDAAGRVIVIDHHATGQPFGDVRLVDPDAAATAVLVERLIREMGGEPDTDIAACLYTGLVTDTGRFQYANATPEVLELGARLVATGIDHTAIARAIWESHRFAYLHLLARVLDRARLLPAPGLAWTAVLLADLDDCGVAPAETEGVIDVLRGVDDVDCAMVLKEQPGGEWKVSLRSRGGTDVGALAGALGGGGHTHAAGFTANGSLEQVVERVIAALALGNGRRRERVPG